MGGRPQPHLRRAVPARGKRSTRAGEWFKNVFEDIRARYPIYKIAIFYVYASEAKVRCRDAQAYTLRWARTERTHANP